MIKIGNDWDNILADEFQKEYFLNLENFLENEYSNQTIYPKKSDIFNALKLTSFENTKVVIIGQDPYHGAGQAHGLSFSVLEGITPPPSLKNIFKELNADVGKEITKNGDLTYLAKQGVLLLNAVLTVREASPASHKNKGWEKFTDRVILELNQKETPVVFLLWGDYAKKKAEIITNPIHKKLISVHPSPLSAYNGFYGGKYFSRANDFLVEHGEEAVDWQL